MVMEGSERTERLLDVFTQYVKAPATGKYSIIPQEDAAFLITCLSLVDPVIMMRFKEASNAKGHGFAKRIKERLDKFDEDMETTQMTALPASDVACLLDILCFLDEAVAKDFYEKTGKHTQLILDKLKKAHDGC